MNKKIVYLLSIIVFLILLVPVIGGYKETKNIFQNNKEKVASLVKECQDNDTPLSISSCQKLKDYKVSYLEYHDELNLNSLENTTGHLLFISLPFIIITLFGLKCLRDGNAKLKDYKKIIIALFKSVYSVAWIYPLIVFIKGILAFYGVWQINPVSIFNIFIPFIDMILAFMFISIIINIGLMVARFLNNPIIYLFGSGIIYTILAFIISQIGNLFAKSFRFGMYIDIFNLTLIETDYIANIIILTLLYISSLGVLFILYKNKKSLINYVKKNV